MRVKNRRDIGQCTQSDCDGKAVQDGEEVTCTECSESYDGDSSRNGLQEYLASRAEADVERTDVQKPPQEIDLSHRDVPRLELLKERFHSNREPRGDTCPFCGKNTIYMYYEPRHLLGFEVGHIYTGPRTFVKCDTCLAAWKNERLLGEDIEAVRKDETRQNAHTRIGHSEA